MTATTAPPPVSAALAGLLMRGRPASSLAAKQPLTGPTFPAWKGPVGHLSSRLGVAIALVLALLVALVAPGLASGLTDSTVGLASGVTAASAEAHPALHGVGAETRIRASSLADQTRVGAVSAVDGTLHPGSTVLYDPAVSGWLVAPRPLAACLRSFSADTEVLMADGTTKPFSEIEVGDLVWATDPEAGESGPRRVEAVWPHEDDLLELTVDSGSVTTTEDHHFWNATDREWQETQHLDAGDLLLTPDGTTVPVGELDWTTRRRAAAYDITVEGVHSYYVVAGVNDVLVHNCDLDALSAAGRAADRNGLTAAGRAAQKHGNRPGSSFPLPSGTTAADYNTFGQNILDDLLTAPNTAIQRWQHPSFGNVTDFRGPNYGARFGPNGEFITFLD